MSEIKRQRTSSRYGITVVALLFVALLAGSVSTMAEDGTPGIRDIIWASLSIIGFSLLLWSLWVDFRQSDERQQLVKLKSTSLAFMFLVFGIVSIQLLDALRLIDLRIALQIVIIGGIILWNIFHRIIERRTLL